MKLTTARPSYCLRFLVVLLSWQFLFQCQRYTMCEAVSCYDFFSGVAKPCFPQPVNMARDRNVSATNTCGMPSSRYCEIGPGTKCFNCDANSSLTMHPARFMVDEEDPFGTNPTWWQSSTWWDANQLGISTTGEPLKVNVTLDFGKSYHISGKIKVTFYSERPHALVIERSPDDGLTWKVYQYFAKNCLGTYGMEASETVPAEDPLKPTCTEEYSGQFPSKNGIVEFQAYARYSPEDYMQPEIQEYMKATQVRLRLEYPATDGMELINSEVSLNRYYYAISDVRVDGRCDCHGHAQHCDGVGMKQYCYCEHHTTGRDCEQCLPLYNNEPWKAANKTHANECQKCDCNDHSDTCSYDANLKTGVCFDCIHNTTGNHCDQCRDGFYRNVEKSLRDVDVCLACDCFPVGIIDDGSCNQELSGDISLGQCHCKENVFGRRCDECVPGHWGFRIPPGGICQDCDCNVFGMINGSKDCDQQTGDCFCKSFIQGAKCDECSDGYFSFPNKSESTCLKCPCDLGGALKTCEKKEGLCHCRQNIEGEYCDVPKSGYFVPSFDFLLFEAEFQQGTFTKQLERHSSKASFTGQGYAKITTQSFVHFNDVKVNVSWNFYIVVRYTAHSLPENITLSVTGTQTSYEVVIPFSELQIGTGLAWGTSKAVYLNSNTTYDVTVNLGSSGPGEVFLLDALVLKPELSLARVYKESDSVDKLRECYKAASSLTSKGNVPHCSGLVFSYGAEMYDGAIVCDCDKSGTSHVDSCNPNGGQCTCHYGVGGRTCGYCLPGYYGFGNGPCQVCQCNSAGISSDICDISSGVCQCKQSTSGVKCDQCKTGTFNLDSLNVQGCQSCFGYGHGSECKSAHGFVASQIASNFTGEELDGWRIENNSSSVVTKDGLNIHHNLTLVAPPKYLGEQLKSYKQRIILKVIPTSAGNLSRDSVIIQFKGHDYQAVLQPSSKTFDAFSEFVFTLDDFHASPALTEFQFQSMLADLTSLKVTVGAGLLLKHIAMETAVRGSGNESASHASFVELMTCFENYTGLSCQLCAVGFTRAVPNAGPFSDCLKCSCNGRAEDCDAESGVCLNCVPGTTGDHCERCQYNVVGPHCNICADGFYGLTEHDRKCQPCNCHLSGTKYGNNSSCNITTGQCYCDKSLHTGGRRCNECQENAWNRSESDICEECPPCFGMIKTDVDKFRGDFSTLAQDFGSLSGLDVFSEFRPFNKHLELTGQAVDELTKTSQALAKKDNDVVRWYNDILKTIQIFALIRDGTAAEVNAALNATVSVTVGYTRTKRILEDTQSLVVVSYHLLNNTVNNLMNTFHASVSLLREWAVTLNETKILSKMKAKGLSGTRSTVDSGLNTAVQLTTQAAMDALSVVTTLNGMLVKVGHLQINTSSLKKTTEGMMEVARQRYYNASMLLNSTLEIDIFGDFSNLSRAMATLNQNSDEITENASNILKAIQNQLQSTSPVVQDIYKTLAKLQALQVQVNHYYTNATNYYTESVRYKTEGRTASTEAQKLYSEAKHLLATIRDFPALVNDAKLASDKGLDDISQLTSFHRSNVLLAINISIDMEPSYDASDMLVQLAKTVEDHGKKRMDDVSKLFIRSKMLQNYTTAAQGIAGQRVAVLVYVETKVTPVRDLCARVTRDGYEALANSTQTRVDSLQLLEKVRSVSSELRQVMKDYQALPTVNTKPLANMKADIARIRASFEALRLSGSLEKLRRGKAIQEQWLVANRPRVALLRNNVAVVKSLFTTLDAKGS